MSSPEIDTAMNGTGGLEDIVTGLGPELGNGDDNHTSTTAPQGPNNAGVPKPKRLACMICRKRKLRCDGNRPRCSTCTRLGHDCAYDEVRRKSGPKRGYVKALEERLKQVETLLKTQDPPAASKPVAKDAPSITVSPDANIADTTSPMASLNIPEVPINIGHGPDQDRWDFTNGDNSPQPQQTGGDTFDFNSITMPGNFTWEMIGLGLEEPLPTQESIDELHQIYFEKIQPSMPMIHKYRYLAAMNLAPNQRPPVCLRYAIWTLASSVSEKFQPHRDLFYKRARKYVEADYIKGFGEQLISVAHAQTHILLAQYEFKMMFFPRAWMSTGSAIRLCQMMGLHRVDGAGLDVKMCIAPPRDWTEKEERRRTFWMAFAEDRYASIGTGWPMTVDEKDVTTHMPASEDAYDLSRPEQMQTLAECLTPSGAANLSTMGGIVLLACLFGRNLLHLHRPDVDDRDHDLNGEFWKRHRNLDNILLNTSLCLPSHLKLSAGLSNPNVIFTNMCIHTSAICLHQAAIFKADKNRLPPSVSAESKVRCINAANEIASTMRMISHIDLSTINPFTSFCLYVGARVFVQYLKSRPGESQIVDSLRFVLAAMNALRRLNPLTESFLVQLDVDLEVLGQRIPKLRTAFPRSTDMNGRPSFIPGSIQTPPSDRPGGGCIISNAFDEIGDAGKTADTIDIDPTLSGAQQQPIPGFSAMNARWQNEGSLSIHEQLRQAGANARFFGSSLIQDPAGTESPDVTSASDRPTPNSSTSASDRHNSGTGTGTRSGQNSFGASPASSSANTQAQRGPTPGMFDGFVGGDLSRGLTPSRQVGVSMGTPKDMTSPSGHNADGTANPNDFSWNSFAAGGPRLTPTSEGVLRTILSMGPMETIDMGWDNPS